MTLPRAVRPLGIGSHVLLGRGQRGDLWIVQRLRYIGDELVADLQSEEARDFKREDVPDRFKRRDVPITRLRVWHGPDGWGRPRIQDLRLDHVG
jgi:hypothetical protein